MEMGVIPVRAGHVPVGNGVQSAVGGPRHHHRVDVVARVLGGHVQPVGVQVGFLANEWEEGQWGRVLVTLLAHKGKWVSEWGGWGVSEKDVRE